MQNKIIITQIVVTILSILLGTILHFTYEWSGKNKIVGLFSATNESTWEHLKLSFFPIIILGGIQYFFVKEDVNNFIEALMIASILSIILIPILFYLYKAILKKDNFILDILIFIISVVISEFVAYRIMIMQNFSDKTTNMLAIIAILLVSIAFAIFTYMPPKLELFRNPLENS